MLSDVERFHWDTAKIIESSQSSLEEQRYEAFGLMDDTPFVVIFTPREKHLRIISLRRSSRQERKLYYDQT